MFSYDNSCRNIQKQYKSVYFTFNNTRRSKHKQQTQHVTLHYFLHVPTKIILHSRILRIVLLEIKVMTKVEGWEPSYPKSSMTVWAAFKSTNSLQKLQWEGPSNRECGSDFSADGRPGVGWSVPAQWWLSAPDPPAHRECPGGNTGAPGTSRTNHELFISQKVLFGARGRATWLY